MIITVLVEADQKLLNKKGVISNEQGCELLASSGSVNFLAPEGLQDSPAFGDSNKNVISPLSTPIHRVRLIDALLNQDVQDFDEKIS